jgi:hypothetical protein
MEEITHFIVAKVSSYNPQNGFKEWYELQPQYDNNIITINMENINESDR